MIAKIIRNEPDPRKANVAIHTGIVYSQLLGDGEAAMHSAIPGNPRKRPLHLAIMVPNEPHARPGMEPVKRKMPVVIYLAGGGFELYEHMGNLSNLSWLCDAGYVVVDVEYRKASESRWPGAAHDVKTAIRFLKTYAEHFDIDPDRIATLGCSAGGYLSAFTAMTGKTKEFDVGQYCDVDSSVAACVDYYGPIDFAKLDEDDTLGTFFLKHNDARSPESQFLGGPLPEIPELCARTNPINYITPDSPPTLILHGTADADVPQRQSERLYEALTAAGCEASLILHEGAGHGNDRAWENDEIHETVVAFLDKHLK